MKIYSWQMGIICLLVILTACEVERPSNVLSDNTMENLLYDYHIAKAMGEDVGYQEQYKRKLYIESVFQKYGTTEEVFDSTMSWYSRHPQVIGKIYENVRERLKAEQEHINELIALRDGKPKQSEAGDSIDVWIGRRIYQLTGMPLDNRLTFVLPSDDNFENRDTLKWTVRYRFLNGNPDTASAPLMAMQIAYKNDSILSQQCRIDSSGIVTLSLASDTLGAIKEVRGYIYYPTRKSVATLLADRISLMRYHAIGETNNPADKDVESAPTASKSSNNSTKQATVGKATKGNDNKAPKRIETSIERTQLKKTE